MKRNNINHIYHLDAFDFLEIIKDNSIDLAVIDPPYNLKKDTWDTFNSDKDFFDFTYRWIDKLIPKIKEGGALYIFNTPYNSAHILTHLIKQGLTYKNWLTWDKRDGFNATRTKFCTNQESILFFTKGDDHTFNHNDIRVPYESVERMKHAAKKGILKNGKRWFPNPDGKLCGDVWHITSERHKNKIKGKVQKMKHMTPKPIDLIERIIKASSNTGDLVLDCFSGSGTTAVAAKKLGRNFICSEFNKEYVKVSNDRLNELDV